MAADANMEFCFEEGKFLNMAAELKDDLLDYSRRLTDNEMARLDIKEGIQDLIGEIRLSPHLKVVLTITPRLFSEN